MTVPKPASLWDAARSFFLIALTVTIACMTPPASAGQPVEGASRSRVVHVVLVWLKEPGNDAHRTRIIQATRDFSDLSGVEEIRVGVPISSRRASVDDSFDVGLYMTFASTNALEAYLDHPLHREAQKSILAPLVERVIVYDFYDDRD